MSEKNALAILGSPHTNGTTAAMLNFAVHKAEQAGYAVTKITLYKRIFLSAPVAGLAWIHIFVFRKMIYRKSPHYYIRIRLLSLPPLSIGQMFRRLSKTYLTDCWERLWKKQTHFQNHVYGGNNI